MKRLGMLLVLVSVGMFALGCSDTKKEKPKTDTKPAAGAADTTTTPADTKPAEPVK